MSTVQVVGYRVIDAGPDRVSLMLAMPVESVYMSANLTLVWHQGDWRLQPPPPGEAVEPLLPAPRPERLREVEWYLMCSPMDMKCHVVEGVQSAASNWIDNVNRVSTDFFSTILNSLATFWVKPETPVSLATSTDDGHTWTDSKTVAFVQGQTLKLTLTILALAIVIAGMRMASEQRAKPVQELLKALLTFVIVCGAGTATVQLLIAWSDDFSLQIIHAAIGGDGFESTMKNLLTNPTEHGSGAGMTSVLMLILLGQIAAWASLIQIVLMLIRSAMLVLLGSTLPLAAAATNTEVGKAWFKKYCAWTLGFIAYKPAAALIYAAAIKLKEDKMLGQGTGLMQSLTALMMMLLAVLAMPARRPASPASTSERTTPLPPSTSTNELSGRSRAPAQPTTHGMPSCRAMIAVWLVAPPRSVTSAATTAGSRPAVSAGARSSATSTDGCSIDGTPGSGAPTTWAVIRRPRSRRSVTRSAIRPPAAVNNSANWSTAAARASSTGVP